MPDDYLFGPISLGLFKHLLGLFIRDGNLARAVLLGKLDLHSDLLTTLVLNLDALQSVRGIVDKPDNLFDKTLVVEIVVVHLNFLNRVDALGHCHCCYGICGGVRSTQANPLVHSSTPASKAFKVVVI